MSRLLPHAAMHLHPGGHVDLIANATELAPVIEVFRRTDAEEYPSGRGESGTNRRPLWSDLFTVGGRGQTIESVRDPGHASFTVDIGL